MPDLCMHDSIEAFLRRNPAARRVFDSLGIDYCCGGARTLEAACLAGRLDPTEVIGLLDGLETAGRDAVLDTDSGFAERADPIERDLHDRLRSELPRLEALARKVAHVHGHADPRLIVVHERFRAFAEGMATRMEALKTIRELTGDYVPPEWACGTYRALLAGLRDLEADMRARVRSSDQGRAISSRQLGKPLG